MCKLLELDVRSIEDKCKGLFFRGAVTTYATNNTIATKTTIKLLKRKSCTGCKQCGWFWEYINETIGDDVDILQNVHHGKMYGVSVTTSTDWESGLKEIDYIEFVEVKDDSNNS